MSQGIRGSYGSHNFERARRELTRWLAANRQYVAEGPPYVVYWNSPFLPPWMKHSEVHIPVRSNSSISHR